MVIKKIYFLLFLCCTSMNFAGGDAYSCLSNNLILRDLEKFDVSTKNILFMENAKQDSFYAEIHKFGENSRFGGFVELETSFISKKGDQYSRKLFRNLSIKEEPTSPYLVEYIAKSKENGLLKDEHIYSSVNQGYASKEALVYNNSKLSYSIKCRIENDSCVELSRLLVNKYYGDSHLLTEAREISKEVFFEGVDLVLDTSFHSTLSTIHYDLDGKYDDVQCDDNDFKFQYLNESCARIVLKDKRIGLFCETSNGKFLKMPKEIFLYTVKMSRFGLEIFSFQRLTDKSLYRLNHEIVYDDNANVKTLVVKEGYPEESLFNKFNKIAPFFIDSLNVEYDDFQRPKVIIQHRKGKNVGSLKYNDMFRYEFLYKE